MNGRMPLAIAANKCDLEKDRHVSQSEAASYAASMGAIHMPTSAKLNKGIDAIVMELTKRIMATASRGGSRGRDMKLNSGGRAGGRQIIFVEDEAQQKEGGCC